MCAVCVDDLCLAVDDPEGLFNQLQSNPHNCKPKGSGPMNFHLGCGFGRDPDCTPHVDPGKHIEKTMDSHEQYFGSKPRCAQSPLVPNDHPESDESDFPDEDGIQQHQCLIGQSQWLISLRRWDTQTAAVMTCQVMGQLPRTGTQKESSAHLGMLENSPTSKPGLELRHQI